jgi:preprotein translocase subunit YajC
MFFSVPAWAQDAAPKGPSAVEQMIPFIAIFAIFYFFIIRPQSKRQKQHVNFLTTLKRGDEVITTGGIYGTVEGLTERFVTLEVADDVKIRILKTQIAGTAAEPTQQQAPAKN